MQVTIATPLFPPDIGSAATYAKELARRLAEHHEVTVVAYGRLPEPVEGVCVIGVDKRLPLPLRLLRFATALFRATRTADVVYVLNGASAELPATFVLRLRGVPYLACVADHGAHQHAARSWARRAIERTWLQHAKDCVTELPATRPEILPFVPYPQAALAEYERTWTAHLAELTTALTHARNH